MDKCILCVDDENSVVTSLKTQLNNFFGDEYEIEVAQSGAEALEILEELIEDGVQLELIVSDFLMPGMNGDEFLIKAHKLLPDVKKLLLTGQADVDGITNIINEGALYRYIAKPWDQTDLVMTVKEALKSYKTTKELEFYTKHLEVLVEQKTLENKTYLDIVDRYLLASKTNLDGKITEVSQALCDISGYTKEELIGQNHRIFKDPDTDKDLYDDLWKTITSGEIWEGEFKNYKKDGGYYWVDCRISPTFNKDREIIAYASIRIDISDRKKVEELSITDELTKLYNRRFFNTIFKKEIDRAHRESKSMGFAILDIDHFKQYNDTYGHQMGDSALVSIGKCLHDSLNRASDYAFRLGGEEFGILVTDTDLEKFTNTVKKVKDVIEGLHIEHRKNSASDYVTASFGGVVFKPDEYTDMDRVFKYSDDLLYVVKDTVRNNAIVKEYVNQ